MNVIIRKSTPQDFPHILALIQAFSIFQKTPEKVSVTLDQMISSQDHFQCFVAASGEKEIVGFASFFPAYYSWSGKAIYLDDLYVKAACRGLGIGKQLLDAIIQIAKEEQCIKVRWQVSKWNSNAIAFYQKIGATIDETEINCDLILGEANK